MLTVLIVALFIALWAWLDGDDFGEGLFMFFIGLIPGVFIAFFLGMFIGLANGPTPLPPERHTLVNLFDNTRTEGTFFLGSGSIDGVPYYSWYEETKPNSFERLDVPSEQAKIHLMAKKQQPYYTIQRSKYTGSFFDTWYLNPNVGEELDDEGTYDFYVPHGAITREFKLDTK